MRSKEAESKVGELLQRLLLSIQNNNIKSPNFNDMKCGRRRGVRRSYSDYDSDDQQEYITDYNQYCADATNLVSTLCNHYASPLVQAVLEMCLYLCPLMRSLQSQFSSDPVWCDAFLKIVGGINLGINRYNLDMTKQAQLLSTGKMIVDTFMKQINGQSAAGDTYLVEFTFSFLWVMKNDLPSLVEFIQLLVSMIANAFRAYKSSRGNSLTPSGNPADQLKIATTASEHLFRVCKLLGKSLLMQLTQILAAIFEQILAARDATVRNNLCSAFRRDSRGN